MFSIRKTLLLRILASCIGVWILVSLLQSSDVREVQQPVAHRRLEEVLPVGNARSRGQSEPINLCILGYTFNTSSSDDCDYSRSWRLDGCVCRDGVYKPNGHKSEWPQGNKNSDRPFRTLTKELCNGFKNMQKETEVLKGSPLPIHSAL
jgi:hypothetical protein